MQSSAVAVSPGALRQAEKTNVRWIVVAVLFFITIINYADRATISLAGPAMAKELNFDAVTMGYIFSAFGWAYVIFQLPGGWLLDKFGSKKVYAFSIFFWSLFTLLVGAVGFFTGLIGDHHPLLAALPGRRVRSPVVPGQQPHRRRVVSRPTSAAPRRPSSTRPNMRRPSCSPRSWAG